MKGLLYRDCIMCWNGFHKNLLMVLILYVALGIGMGADAILSVIVFLTGNYAVALLSFDENSKWDTYARTLPLSAGMQVLARYIVCLLMIAAGALASLLLMFGVDAVRGVLDPDMVRIDLATVVVMTFLVMVYDGVALPLAYRFGAAKAQSTAILAFIVPVIGGIALLIHFFPGVLDIVEELDFSAAMWGPVGAAVLLGLGLLLLFVSYALSSAIYRRREY